MPHSNQTRAKKERLAKQLQTRTQSLYQLKQKHFKDAQIITLPKVSLGDLRRRFKPTHYPLPTSVLRSKPNYTHIPSDPSIPLLIYGSDGGLLACKTHLKRPDLIQKLSDSIDNLPPPKHYKHKGITRSEYQTRHLGVWAAYMKEPNQTLEHRWNQEEHDKFLKENSELFRQMSALLGQMAPGVFKEFQKYPLPNHQRACGAWAACVINNGGNNPNQTEIHRDVKESQYGYSCIVSCGNYTGGHLVLYDLGYTIEMIPGDLLLFPDSLIHHSNEPATGVRKSVVCFTQENVYDYWHRTYAIPLKRHQAKERRKKKENELKVRKHKEDKANR